MITLIKEAIIVGIIITFIGLIISYIVMYFSHPNLIGNFNHWTSIVLTLFFTGFIFFFGSEYVGLNNWYCNYGSACLKIKK